MRFFVSLLKLFSLIASEAGKKRSRREAKSKDYDSMAAAKNEVSERDLGEARAVADTAFRKKKKKKKQKKTKKQKKSPFFFPRQARSGLWAR